MFDTKEFLEMSKEDRWVFLRKNVGKFSSLAYLAFQLRDEAEKKVGLLWSGALHKVFCIAKGNHLDNEIPKRIVYEFFAIKAKPVHWIAAALEALKNGK